MFYPVCWSLPLACVMLSLQKYPMGRVLPTKKQTSQGMFTQSKSIQEMDLWWQNQYTTIHFEKSLENRHVHVKTFIRKNNSISKG